jgi:hypothetical protein
MLQTGRSWVRFPMRSLNILDLPNRSSLGFIQSLTEMSTRYRKIMFLGNRGRPVSKVDNITAICEPVVSTMVEPRRLSTL